MCSCDTGNALNIEGRLLHYVLKVGNRVEAVRFFTEILGMKILRNEEFPEECVAVCKGSTYSRWSKTIVGYTPEESNFVFQLTYNYSRNVVMHTNHLVGITIQSKNAIQNAQNLEWPIGKGYTLEAPGGCKFFIKQDSQVTRDMVDMVSLASFDLEKSMSFWIETVGMKGYARTSNSIILGFSRDQTKLEFVKTGEKLSHLETNGVIAFSCPREQHSEIETKIRQINPKSVISAKSLDPPLKTDVNSVVIRDPDGHVACFYDESEFRKRSVYQEEAEGIVQEQLQLESQGICALECDCPGSCIVQRQKIRSRSRENVDLNEE